MRVVIFSTNYLPHIGGAEVAIKEVTDRLEDTDFTIITARLDRSCSRREQIGNAEVHRIGIGHRVDVFFLAAFGWLRALVLHWRNGFDLVWAMMASQGAVAASIFQLITGCRLVLTLQEGDEEAHLRRYVGGSNVLYKLFIRPFHYLPIKVSDRITAISEHLKQRARSVVEQTPITVIPNGVDLEKFTQDFPDQQINKLRRQYVDDDGVLIISTSRLVEKNGLDDLIESLTHLPDRFKLLILGEGRLRGKLEERVDELQLHDRVYLPGSVEFLEVPKYLQAADIFARPSLSEGMGNSFIEAMAAGMPVVATPVGGITDFLEGKQTGLFAEPRNSKSIAQQIKRLTEDESLRETIVENAYSLATDKYDWDTIAEKYKDVFNRRSG